MKSKYPLDPEFADIPDLENNNSSRLALNIGNVLLKFQAKQAKADNISVTQRDEKISGYLGKKIKVRIFSPMGEDGELPCIVNFHGGAFVGTGMRHQLRYCINFAEHTRCRVIFVDYRLALRHPFPVPVEDCYAALMWTYDNAETLGIRNIAEYAKSSFGCPVLFYTSPAFDSPAYGEAVGRLKELSSEMGFGVIDLWNDFDISALSPREKALCFADAIHPTRAGYAKIFLPSFENALEALFEK